MNADRYLDRLGLARADVAPPDHEALRTLQAAHVRTVPFENIAITGDPEGNGAEGVTLDRRYVVDVGVAVPTIRQPLPLDGTLREDEAGVAWRVVESDRPDADYCAQFRNPGGDWQNRYVFRDRPVTLDFFRASCEFLAAAPESPFTSDPFATIATPSGHRKLEPGTLTVIENGETRERPVDPREWHDVLEREFGISLSV
ncbi:MAG: arylamine N-acetyltransferase [Halobacteriales archaeon SW_9_67_25]|nr:MAG: arylamine N-acetyltransferase [Halobacteriales archaeon SW_9_67_25]